REGDRVEHDPQERARIVHGRPEVGRAPAAAAALGRHLRDEEDVGECEGDRGEDDEPWDAPQDRTHEQHAIRVRTYGSEVVGHAGSDRNRGSLSMAIASTSIFAPGTASREISTSVLAGRAEPNASWRTGLISGRSSTSVRKTVTLTTSAKLDPPAARTAPRSLQRARADVLQQDRERNPRVLRAVHGACELLLAPDELDRVEVEPLARSRQADEHGPAAVARPAQGESRRLRIPDRVERDVDAVP